MAASRNVTDRAHLSTSFARLCRDTRARLGWSQDELARRSGMRRAQISRIELGRCDPTLATVDRLGDALGLEINLAARPPIILEIRQRDLVHARCSGYVDRRLTGSGWLTAREVEVVHGRSRGWIDLVAFDPRTGILLIVEIKTRLDDLGLVERQLAWYERAGFDVARRLGFPARRLMACLVALSTDEVEAFLRSNREALGRGFPLRAPEMSAVINGAWPRTGGRALALIDPSSRRHDWLVRSRMDGRRSPSAYRDYADAARQFGQSAPG